MPEHEAAVRQGSSAQLVGDFLYRHRERIAQRWADEPLFRSVFTLSRDEAVEAARTVIEALAQVAESDRVYDTDAIGFEVVREQLARMAAARSRAGITMAQVSGEVDALRPPVAEFLVEEFPDAATEQVRECTTALTVLALSRCHLRTTSVAEALCTSIR